MAADKGNSGGSEIDILESPFFVCCRSRLRSPPDITRTSGKIHAPRFKRCRNAEQVRLGERLVGRLDTLMRFRVGDQQSVCKPHARGQWSARVIRRSYEVVGESAGAVRGKARQVSVSALLHPQPPTWPVVQ